MDSGVSCETSNQEVGKCDTNGNCITSNTNTKTKLNFCRNRENSICIVMTSACGINA